MPDSPMHTTSSDFRNFCKDIMSISLFQNPDIREVVVHQVETETTISRLTDRLHTELQTETDQDYIQLTKKKLVAAELRLEELQDEFEGSHVGDVLSRCNEYSRSMNGPLFQPAEFL